MPSTAQEVYNEIIQTLTLAERLRLATLILNSLVENNVALVEQSDRWSKQDQTDLTNFSLQHADTIFSDEENVE
ncbi:hypothetical protein H6F67_20455 [Microcoleus sp. FACHB-1515]|uniref:hypothetical protein n=1 Tax=Cyanophyceae TaxID=3028117 RepID=UPI001687FF54|nr:hypothetical protein [Microcoleus sp. FACHB-1515]MBD2092226.1 hypothetical protein [Microcoleus sp. FACHB-1515]